MATAIIIGSVLASGGGALAGAAAAGTFLGISAGTFGLISAGLGLASQAFSIFGGNQSAQASYDAQVSASRAALESGRVQFAQSELDVQREKTQAAVEDAERQRKLRRVLAQQRAQFAGGGFDPFSGTPQAIQESTAGEINRETRLADAATQDRVTSINTQGLGVLAQSKGKAVSLLNSAEIGRLEAKEQRNKQIASLGGDVIKFGELLK